MAKFLDLDALVPPDKEVQLGGQKYKITTDISVRQRLAFQRTSQEGIVTAETIDVILDILQTAFQKYHNEKTAEWLIDNLNDQQLTAAINLIFEVDTEEKK